MYIFFATEILKYFLSFLEPDAEVCKPPNKIIDGICTQPETVNEVEPEAPVVQTVPNFRPVATAAPEVNIPLPDPPRPTYPPKPLAALPTLPPAIANKTFITPPVVEDTFQVKNNKFHKNFVKSFSRKNFMKLISRNFSCFN